MEKQDVVVIGGGIIGIACAYYLSKAGRGVQLLEQDTIGSGASHGNCGIIFTEDLAPLCSPGALKYEINRLLKGTSPLFIKLDTDIKRFLWLINFARKCKKNHLNHALKAREQILKQSKILFQSLFSNESINCRWEKKGILLVYKTEKEMVKYTKTNALLKPFNMQAKPYIGKALFDLEPALLEGLYGGWYHDGTTHLRPDELIEAWKRVLLKRGIDLVEDCCLTGFKLEKNKILRAITTKGEYKARDFVLALGAWSTQMTDSLKFRLPVQPGKGYSITMERPAICPQIPCYLYEKSVVVTPWKNGYRLGGTMEFSGFNSNLYPKRIEALKDAAKEYMKQSIGNTIIEEWVGMRPMIYDDLPAIGKAPGIKNLIIATGHGMTGLSMATSTGKLTEELITGKTPHIDPYPFSVMRFQS